MGTYAKTLDHLLVSSKEVNMISIRNYVSGEMLSRLSVSNVYDELQGLERDLERRGFRNNGKVMVPIRILMNEVISGELI